ncbi:hypothetical protein [Micromonospora eburnea]|uniref:Uncharacterized protein n=1 Tax=Micromonospora eburnea TaxID=227316 RepID=A0A1C6TQR0_9ACTN|nr:hypothetical protein [Micromonospora eburnea]SCL44097.1 hypothetical protein GA0070604_0194 [Micromonospora eburnea]
MRIRFWRQRPEAALRVPRQRPEAGLRVPRQWIVKNEQPTWASQPTDVFPTDEPGRAGNLTPAQRWRAGGWRRNGGAR